MRNRVDELVVYSVSSKRPNMIKVRLKLQPKLAEMGKSVETAQGMRRYNVKRARAIRLLNVLSSRCIEIR